MCTSAALSGHFDPLPLDVRVNYNIVALEDIYKRSLRYDHFSEIAHGVTSFCIPTTGIIYNLMKIYILAMSFILALSFAFPMSG